MLSLILPSLRVFDKYFVWSKLRAWASAMALMKKRQVWGTNQNCSKFEMLCCCNWEQNTAPYLQNSSKIEPKPESELIWICSKPHHVLSGFYKVSPLTWFEVYFGCCTSKSFLSKNQIFSYTVAHLWCWLLKREILMPIQALEVLQLCNLTLSMQKMKRPFTSGDLDAWNKSNNLDFEV